MMNLLRVEHIKTSIKPGLALVRPAYRRQVRSADKPHQLSSSTSPFTIWALAPDTGHSRPVRKQQPRHRQMSFAATRSQITPSNDDREPQTEQTIVGLPPRKLQSDRMDTR